MANATECIVAESDEEEAEAAMEYWVQHSSDLRWGINRGRVATLSFGLLLAISGAAMLFTKPFPDLARFYAISPWFVSVGVIFIISAAWLQPGVVRWNIKSEARRFRSKHRDSLPFGRYTVCLANESLRIESSRETSLIPMKSLLPVFVTEFHVHFLNEFGLVLTLGRGKIVEGDLDIFLSRFEEIRQSMASKELP